MTTKLTVCGTGHRPEHCEEERIVRVKARVKLQYSPVGTYISGMAAGFDLWSADEARLLGLQVIVARPWAGHKPRNGDEDLYSRILDHAVKVVDISESDTYPGAHIYQKRNEWMVDNSDAVLAYYTGVSGGTENCWNYAKKVGKPVTNVYLSPPF